MEGRGACQLSAANGIKVEPVLAIRGLGAGGFVSKAAIEIAGSMKSGYERILTPDALAFCAALEERFGAKRRVLLAAREERQTFFDSGGLPDFLPETAEIRGGDWKVAPIPADLLDRRAEITGPVERKMMINALNSGAKAFMADFEDALAPSWDNLVQGQINLYDYWRGGLTFSDPARGKSYAVGDNPATLIVRPRGWHLEEAHLLHKGKRMSASLCDFGLYFFHNHAAIKQRGSGPYFYLPKMESHKEAELWNDVFVFAQEALGVPLGTIKTTVLIETLPAAFEMDEILYVLRDHIAGLNCGRWDYIFSYIKSLAAHEDRILPDRAQVVMGEAFLHNYSLLLIKTCHRRGAFAMGGMAAQIPVKGDEEANRAAFAKVRADKEREARDGHDGTWIAHPGLVAVAVEVFDEHMPAANQLDKQLDGQTDTQISQQDLLEVHRGERTEKGLRECIRVGVQYIAAWLSGRGAVPLYNLMEDAATAEICRSQLWQWLRYSAALSDGRVVDDALFSHCLDEEMAQLRQGLGEEVWRGGHFERARALFADMVRAKACPRFLTLPAYEDLLKQEKQGGGK